jgi:hypothetical protein
MSTRAGWGLLRGGEAQAAAGQSFSSLAGEKQHSPSFVHRPSGEVLTPEPGVLVPGRQREWGSWMRSKQTPCRDGAEVQAVS